MQLVGISLYDWSWVGRWLWDLWDKVWGALGGNGFGICLVRAAMRMFLKVLIQILILFLSVWFIRDMYYNYHTYKFQLKVRFFGSYKRYLALKLYMWRLIRWWRLLRRNFWLKVIFWWFRIDLRYWYIYILHIRRLLRRYDLLRGFVLVKFIEFYRWRTIRVFYRHFTAIIYRCPFLYFVLSDFIAKVKDLKLWANSYLMLIIWWRLNRRIYLYSSEERWRCSVSLLYIA